MGRQTKRPGRPRKLTNKLGRWIDAAGMTREQAAKRLDVDRYYLDRLCRNDRRPDLELAFKIERLSKGTVPAIYWLAVPRHSKDGRGR